MPKHVAITMDGNGRWAQNKNLTRISGHKKGAEVAKEIVLAANGMGIKYLTLYAFSLENWQRDREEVRGILDLLKLYLQEQDIFDKGFAKREKITPFESKCYRWKSAWKSSGGLQMARIESKHVPFSTYHLTTTTINTVPPYHRTTYTPPFHCELLLPSLLFPSPLFSSSLLLSPPLSSSPSPLLPSLHKG